jgi:hypothetical protein
LGEQLLSLTIQISIYLVLMRSYVFFHLFHQVLALNEVIPKETTLRPSTMQSRATKQAYFLQKGVELSQKKREADKKKEKYMKEAGGFKFTALAMASRE